MLKSEVLNNPAKLRELSVAELRAADHQLKEQQMKLRLQHAIGQVEKTHLIREARRQRARVLTLIGEKLAHGAAVAHAEAHAAAAHATETAHDAGKAPAAKPHAKKAAPHAKAKAPVRKTAKPAGKKPAAKKAAKAKPAAKKGAKKK